MPRRSFPVEFEQADGWTVWMHPLPGYKVACCDCGLIHEFEFRLEDNRLVFRARRLERNTAAHRRERRKRGDLKFDSK
jgi:hypothetical protein